jgi:hydrogenase maturation protease
MNARPLVLGIGNELRGDDGAGRQVARLVARDEPSPIDVQESEGDVATLLDQWTGRQLTVVIDAMQGGAHTADVMRFEIRAGEEVDLPAVFSSPVSSHGLGIAEAVRLGAALGRLPERLILYGIRGANYERGSSVDSVLEPALTRVARYVVEDITSYREAGYA